MRWEFLYAIFLELHKAYGALDRYRCLKILEGCRVLTAGLPRPMYIMVPADDSGPCGRVLRHDVQEVLGSNPGVYAVLGC